MLLPLWIRCKYICLLTNNRLDLLPSQSHCIQSTLLSHFSHKIACSPLWWQDIWAHAEQWVGGRVWGLSHTEIGSWLQRRYLALFWALHTWVIRQVFDTAMWVLNCPLVLYLPLNALPLWKGCVRVPPLFSLVLSHVRLSAYVISTSVGYRSSRV